MIGNRKGFSTHQITNGHDNHFSTEPFYKVGIGEYKRKCIGRENAAKGIQIQEIWLEIRTPHIGHGIKI